MEQVRCLFIHIQCSGFLAGTAIKGRGVFRSSPEITWAERLRICDYMWLCFSLLFCCNPATQTKSPNTENKLGISLWESGLFCESQLYMRLSFSKFCAALGFSRSSLIHVPLGRNSYTHAENQYYRVKLVKIEYCTPPVDMPCWTQRGKL